MRDLEAFSKQKKCLVLTAFVIFIVKLFSFGGKQNLRSHNRLDVNGLTVDVVYTFVNGSDPKWILDKQTYQREETQEDDSFNMENRYRSNNELMYSLRSIEKNAPWINKVHVVVASKDQVPSWLDITHPKINIVLHRDIFTDEAKSHLPVFNSAAIEMHLHKIRGLAEDFIYFNDDILLGSKVIINDFVTELGRPKVFFAWDTPLCAEQCFDEDLGNTFCDKECNYSACLFDRGDCLGENVVMAESNDFYYHDTQEDFFDTGLTADEVEDGTKLSEDTDLIVGEVLDETELKEDGVEARWIENQESNPYLESSDSYTVDPYNRIAEEYKLDAFASSLRVSMEAFAQLIPDYTPSTKVMAHMPHLLNKKRLERMNNIFRKEMILTSSHRFRSPNDLQFAYMYFNFLMYEKSTFITLEQAFTFFDTDGSGELSFNELRSLYVAAFPENPPLGPWSDVETREALLDFRNEIVQNSLWLKLFGGDNNIEDLMLVDKQSVLELAQANTGITPSQLFASPAWSDSLRNNIGDVLESTQRSHSSIGYETVYTQGNPDFAFIMLQSGQVLDEVSKLDSLRNTRPKFLCINDDMQAESDADGNVDQTLSYSKMDIIADELALFYETWLPLASSFEKQYKEKQYLSRRSHSPLLCIGLVFAGVAFMRFFPRFRQYSNRLLHRKRF